jgi:CRISPR-associated protein Cas1
MSTLLLDRAGLEVRSDGNALALYEAGERRGSVPLALLERCIIQGGQTRLDSGVLLKLAEAGVTTVLFSPRAGRRVATVLGPAHNDAAVRLAQAHRVGDAAWCLQWSRQIVRAKLLRQRRALRTWLAARPDARKPLTDALASLDAALRRLADPADPAGHAGHADEAPADAAAGAAPLHIAALRGLEGAAARAHFAGLAAVLPPALGFAGRNRRPPRDPANVCLSLAYTLLHVEAVQACHIAGLDPLLGFYHRPAFGRESLASDLIEPLRGAADVWAWQLLRERRLREEHFSNDRGACLLGKAGRASFYAAWAGESRPWRRWLRQRAVTLARHLRGEGLAWVDTDPDDDEALA